nr:hypothetical protein [Halomarina salina]
MVAVAALGGAVGAALGGYLALGALGCLVLVGELLAALDVSVPAAVPTPLGYSVWLGPHVVLGGGVAAAAFAARRGYMDPSFRYHPAKDVTRPLGGESKALLVGAVFGVFGAGVAWVYATVGAPFDPVAATVVVSAFAHRVALGYPLVGEIRGGLLDVSPYDRGERREPMTDGGSTLGNGPSRQTGERSATSDRPTDPTTRLVVEPFLPYQCEWRTVAALGVGAGLVASALAYVTASAFLPFGLAAAALLGFAFTEEVPVAYHVAFVAGIAVLALAPADATAATLAESVSLPVALGVGTVAGLATALCSELLERAFYAHGDTHFDAPFAAVFVCSLVVAVLDLAGVVTSLPF